MEYTKKMTIKEILTELGYIKNNDRSICYSVVEDEVYNSIEFTIMYDDGHHVTYISDVEDIIKQMDIYHIIEVLENSGWQDEDLEGTSIEDLKWQEIGTDGEYHQYGVNFEN